MGRHKKYIGCLCSKCGDTNPEHFYPYETWQCKACAKIMLAKRTVKKKPVKGIGGTFVITEGSQQFTGRFMSIELTQKHYREHFEHFPDYRNRRFAIGEWRKGELIFIEEL